MTALCCSGFFDQCLCFLRTLDVAPIVCGRVLFAATRIGVRQAVESWLAMFGIASAPWPSNLHEPKRNNFADCWGHTFPRNAKLYKVLVGDGEFAVIVAAMVGKLDLKTRKHLVPAQA